MTKKVARVHPLPRSFQCWPIRVCQWSKGSTTGKSSFRSPPKKVQLAQSIQAPQEKTTRSGLEEAFHSGTGLGPEKVIPFGPRKDGWWTQMCRLKRWPPKSPWRNIHSQEPRAPKSCSIRAPIRAPKSCSIRVPDSAPEKSYTIRASKRWLVDTNVQIETVASKEPPEKHAQPRAPGLEKLFDSGPDSGPETLFHSGPGFGPRKVVYHSGPEKMAGGHKCAD